MDRHLLAGTTAEDVAGAHLRDLEIQDPSAVRDLSIGKGFEFRRRPTLRLKGFDEPIRAFEVAFDHEAPRATATPAA